MQTIELTAKSVNEARAQAAEKFGVPADSVTITVLEETKGLFGKSNVRVRAEAAGAASAVAEEVPVAAESAPIEEAKPAKKPRATAKKAAPTKAVVEAVAEEPVAEPQAAVEAPSEPVATQADADLLAGFASDIIEASGLDCKVSLVDFSGKYVNLSIDGRDASYLVGKSGEVLNQLQYLLNVISAQQLHNGVRSTIDGADYRRRRETQLTALAEKIATAVAERGEEAVLDALPAFERRIIHKALSEFKGIVTYSEGEEPERRVVIAPAE